MKNNKILFHFDLGIFPSTIFVAFGYDSVLDICDRIGIDKEDVSVDEEENGLAITYCFPDGNSCLLFKEPFYSINDLTLLVHEIDHVIHGTMRFYDLPHSVDTAEVSAYMSHYIFLQVIQKLRIDEVCLKKK